MRRPDHSRLLYIRDTGLSSLIVPIRVFPGAESMVRRVKDLSMEGRVALQLAPPQNHTP